MAQSPEEILGESMSSYFLNKLSVRVEIFYKERSVDVTVDEMTADEFAVFIKSIIHKNSRYLIEQRIIHP